MPEAGPLVLFGGIYDWYDPGLLLSAWPEVRKRVPDARLLFFESPNPDTTPQGVFEAARAAAKAIDPDGRSIVFSPWLPYASRADLYAASDLAVSIASEGLETELAYRTRLLDAAWGGVPSVAVAGGALARELASAGAAIECDRDARGSGRIGIGAAPRRPAAESAWGSGTDVRRGAHVGERRGAVARVGAERARGSGPASADGGGRGGWRRRLPPRANL